MQVLSFLKQYLTLKPVLSFGFSIFVKPKAKWVCEIPSIKPTVTLSVFKNVPVRLNYSFEPYRPIRQTAKAWYSYL